MVADQYAYSKGRTFTRRVSAAFAVLFGLSTLFFTATPKNTAHADTPEGCGQYGTCTFEGGSTPGGNTPDTPDTADVGSDWAGADVGPMSPCADSCG